jgi:glucuronate isomerase
LYHWTHLELRKPFGIVDRLLNPQSAKGIWEECNAKLSTAQYSTQGILQQMNVETVCTTDDPVDTLEFHRKISSDSKFKTKIYPAFRPDKAMAVENPSAFMDYVDKLSKISSVEVNSYATFITALRNRHEYFHEMGSRVSDHGIETIYFEDYTEPEIRAIFLKVIHGNSLNNEEILKFKSAMLYEFAIMDWEKGWVQQYHLGALRNNNTRMMRTLGPDTGYDSIGDFEFAKPLARFLSRLDNENKLAKTILYNLNPRDNELLATMVGNFQDGSISGKIQYGAAWWFLDQIDGMKKQIEALSNMGILSQFVGMLTDSRSFLSYPRHDYFRRILCNILGNEMASGLIPSEMELVGKMVQDICYFNAKKYFPFSHQQ